MPLGPLLPSEGLVNTKRLERGWKWLELIPGAGIPCPQANRQGLYMVPLCSLEAWAGPRAFARRKESPILKF